MVIRASRGDELQLEKHSSRIFCKKATVRNALGSDDLLYILAAILSSFVEVQNTPTLRGTFRPGLFVFGLFIIDVRSLICAESSQAICYKSWVCARDGRSVCFD